MITVIMQFALPKKIMPDEALARFTISSQKYVKISGLIRKYFTVSSDGNTAVGIYLWESRAAAESLFTSEWLGDQEKRLHIMPTLQWLECPVVVDNLHGEVIIDE